MMDRRDSSLSGVSHAETVFDELLVTLVLSGDRRAAERLAQRWQPRLLRTARRLLLDEEAALGAVQDSWIAILRGIGGLSDTARFPAWAFAILRRKCIDRIRTRQRHRAHDGGSLDEMSLPSISDQTEERLAILQAFATLPESQRLVAHLHYIEGLALAEIAIAADIPTGTVKSRLFHARTRLKAALQTIDQGEDQ